MTKVGVEMSRKSWNQVRIDTGALQTNFKFFQKKAGAETRVMAMVKADGYGHGMVETARVFAEAGCDAFGIAEICEGVALRRSGIEGDIFVLLGFSQENTGLFFQYNLVPVVFDSVSIERISKSAVEHRQNIGIHLKVDCGMGRLGVVVEEATALVSLIDKLPGISLKGIMAHFPASEDPLSTSTILTEERFSTLCERLGTSKYICHIANSGAVLNFPHSCHDMVRPGIGLYGYHPAGKRGQGSDNAECLLPAMSFTTKILQVKKVPANYGISYGHSYVTKQPTQLAVLPVGYEDGYLRALSNRAEVLIHGRRFPIRGRICMNLCMADITGLEGVQPGDEVVLLGSQGDEMITADEIGRWANTISYEVLCLFGNNNRREYFRTNT